MKSNKNVIRSSMLWSEQFTSGLSHLWACFYPEPPQEGGDADRFPTKEPWEVLNFFCVYSTLSIKYTDWFKCCTNFPFTDIVDRMKLWYCYSIQQEKSLDRLSLNGFWIIQLGCSKRHCLSYNFPYSYLESSILSVLAKHTFYILMSCWIQGGAKVGLQLFVQKIIQ